MQIEVMKTDAKILFNLQNEKILQRKSMGCDVYLQLTIQNTLVCMQRLPEFFLMTQMLV